MELGEFLERFKAQHWRCGARLTSVEFGFGRTLELYFRVLLVGGGASPSGVHGLNFKGDSLDLRVLAEGAEDWHFVPEHTLLEGTCEIELVEQHERLTRAYLESLDCEGDRTCYPDRVVMLQFGSVWVVAESFDAVWIERYRKRSEFHDEFG
ncbi:MAG: hypothetical protein JNK25_10010 [Phycisphaerae bacterium]|nr:hypothetical protein [Phycisphaerae bacterium]